MGTKQNLGSIRKTFRSENMWVQKNYAKQILSTKKMWALIKIANLEKKNIWIRKQNLGKKKKIGYESNFG